MPWNRLRFPGHCSNSCFDRLRLPVQAGALNRACTQAQPAGDKQPPLQRIGMILKLLKLRGVQPVVLRFARFDLRRLPALVYCQDEWQLLERNDSGLLLRTADMKTQPCSEAALQEAVVLWLHCPASPNGG